MALRIGELAQKAGVSTDTIRFYERQGVLPRPPRRENGYRTYSEADVEHVRLLVDLRNLEIPLEEAAEVATMCHLGHCTNSGRELPALIAERRAVIAERIHRLQTLDRRLDYLAGHLEPALQTVEGIPGACCAAAAAVITAGEGLCPCCQPQEA
jgi:DNA-binding transcriptional MerR regulator